MPDLFFLGWVLLVLASLCVCLYALGRMCWMLQGWVRTLEGKVVVLEEQIARLLDRVE